MTDLIDGIPRLSQSVRQTILKIIDKEQSAYKDQLRKGVSGVAVHRRRVNALNRVLQMAEAYEALQANAKPIDAVPDLLDALKGVIRVADRKTVEFDAARAAIAKVEGGI